MKLPNLEDVEKMDETFARVFKSKGSKRGKLLDVLNKALHHNSPNTVVLGLATAEDRGSTTLETLGYRMGLVQRHMQEAQNALQEIYKTAKERGYSDIVSIFERPYLVGHPTE